MREDSQPATLAASNKTNADVDGQRTGLCVKCIREFAEFQNQQQCAASTSYLSVAVTVPCPERQQRASFGAVRTRHPACKGPSV